MEIGPQAWGVRYEIGSIPWDLGAPHPELASRLDEDPALGLGTPGSALVPGAGRGWDAAALAEAGWTVLAVDWAPGITDVLPDRVRRSGIEYREADAFGVDGTFDLLFDHTFFAAVDPDLRPRVGELAGRVVGPGGMFASIVFPIGRPLAAGGPPYGVTLTDVGSALGDGFELREAGPERTLPGRRHPYRWGAWGRR